MREREESRSGVGENEGEGKDNEEEKYSGGLERSEAVDGGVAFNERVRLGYFWAFAVFHGGVAFGGSAFADRSGLFFWGFMI